MRIIRTMGQPGLLSREGGKYTMAADDFTLVPTWVMPLAPEFHNIITQSESMKKNYQNLSSDGLMKYKLVFEKLGDTNFWLLHNHYYDRLGGYDSFLWKSVPAWIDTDQDDLVDGTDMTGRWVEGSFQFQPESRSWSAEIVFEKVIA